MQKNDILTGRVIDYTHDGLGVVKVDNFPIFIDRGGIYWIQNNKIKKESWIW